MENTSGQGKTAAVPTEVRGWNWGAFLLTWIWGVGNDTFIALLALLPLIGFIMRIVLGIKGNEWAWQNRKWDSVEHFKNVQRKWAFWSLILVGVVVVFLGFMIAALLLGGRRSPPYAMALERARSNQQISTVLGSPIKPGWFGAYTGDIKEKDSSGSADISFPIKGPNGSGKVYVTAKEESGQWKFDKLSFRNDSNAQSIDLLAQ